MSHPLLHQLWSTGSDDDGDDDGDDDDVRHI